MEIKRLTIDKIITGGDGLGFADGKAHFVPEVLPGEVVEVEVISNKKGFNRCRLENVIERSKDRVEPFCEYYSLCGGCNMQHITYNKQLEIKKEMVVDIFRRNGKLDINKFDIIHSADRGYRNRVQFHVSNKVKGFKKRQSDNIVNIEACPLLCSGLNNFLSDDPLVFGDRVTIFASDDKYYVGGADTVACIKIKNKEIKFDPEGFFQSNISLLPGLIDKINSSVHGSVVMDLYCGIGLFSSFLPDNVDKIICVEIDKRVEPFIEHNIGNRDYIFYNMSLENYLKKKLNIKNTPSTIIVDPPRKGLSSNVRDFLIRSGAKRVIYVSCDPVTMARDIKELTDACYSLVDFELYDFYPHTSHIESLGILDLV